MATGDHFRPRAPGYNITHIVDPPSPNSRLFSSAGRTSYRAPEVEKLDPEKFHYYQRDQRRLQPRREVILNPAFGADGQLLLPEARHNNQIPAAGGSIHVAAATSPASLGGDAVTKPPTRKYQWRVSQEQPPASGYFTITNVQ